MLQIQTVTQTNFNVLHFSALDTEGCVRTSVYLFNSGDISAFCAYFTLIYVFRGIKRSHLIFIIFNKKNYKNLKGEKKPNSLKFCVL